MNSVVIADTSCLIALSNVDLLDVLKNLYQEITITKEVQAEFGASLPKWISVKEVKNIGFNEELMQFNSLKEGC